MRRPLLVSVAVLALAVPPVEAAAVRRIAGPDRYGTAAAVAADRWTSPSDVFLANGTDPADALAGSFGSGLHSSPLLLTEHDAIPASTFDALRSIDPSTVHVLGGTAAVSGEVVAALRAEGWRVRRHAGADRYGTAAAVAGSEGAAIVGSWPSRGATALLANGRRPFDALAAGPLAAGQLFPVLLTETDSVPEVTMSALADLDIRHVLVLGGTGVISDGVVESLSASGRTVRRVAGADRMATAVAVADLLVELGHHIVRAGLTSASSPADALGAGPWGAPATPILLCESRLSCGTSTTEWARTNDLEEIVVIGGSAAVSDAAAMAVAR